MNSHFPALKIIILIVGDLLVILSFVWIGRTSHNFSVLNVSGLLSTALPFIIAWFGIAPWFGLYRNSIYLVRRKLIPRLVGTWVIAVPLALVLRALFMSRGIPTGIAPTFAAIALLYIGVVALCWRLGFIWWNRRLIKTGKT